MRRPRSRLPGVTRTGAAAAVFFRSQHGGVLVSVIGKVSAAGAASCHLVPTQLHSFQDFMTEDRTFTPLLFHPGLGGVLLSAGVDPDAPCGVSPPTWSCWSPADQTAARVSRAATRVYQHLSQSLEGAGGEETQRRTPGCLLLGVCK